MAKVNVLSTLKKIFPNIHFNIRTQFKDCSDYTYNDEENYYCTMEPSENLYFVLRSLETELRKANKKLSLAIRHHKLGNIPIEELQDHEFNVHEIKTQIEDVTLRLNYK
jgi:hypothetical protein